MSKAETEENYWSICKECHGSGKKRRRLGKKEKLRYQKDLDNYEKTSGQKTVPIRPKGELHPCIKCGKSGLVSAECHPIEDKENFPHLAIIGGGIGGVALAVACLHRSIPFTLYERDINFRARAQGYGLTLQQASKAIQGLGVFSLPDGVISTKHVVHNTNGKVIGEWGMRKWLLPGKKIANKRTNVHIARQSLRLALLNQLAGNDAIRWGHQLIDLKNDVNGQASLTFQVDGKLKSAKADLVIGADGIRSSVRNFLRGVENNPLQYLGCIVILGICDLKDLKDLDNSLLDSATVFQTANGNERIYVMPYTSNSIMWQLSFPMAEKEAIDLSALGNKALKIEASRRTQWHEPIPQIIAATIETRISGYPVYDRKLLHPELLNNSGPITLIGDAAHPMSPFKGQGANQALLDALALARAISKECRTPAQWRKIGIRISVLTNFEAEMLARCASKVKDSAEAAKFLHSEIVLHEANEPRGRCIKSNK